MQRKVAHLTETCHHWLHIKKEEDMPNALRTEGSPPAAPRAAGRTAWPGTSQAAPAPGQRWPAFALLVVTYFITIVDFTIVNVALPTPRRRCCRCGCSG
jgi:hypothetical protein